MNGQNLAHRVAAMALALSAVVTLDGCNNRAPDDARAVSEWVHGMYGVMRV